MKDEKFAEFKKRLVLEAWLKTFVCAFIVGFALTGLTALICWLAGYDKIWPAFVALAAGLCLTIPAFYFLAFRPTDKKLAVRLDALGLDERILTMNELEGDTSFMAMKQREDAVAALGRVNPKLLKVAVAVPLLIALGACCLFGTGMVVVSAVVDCPDYTQTVTMRSFTIDYSVKGEGTVIGGDSLKQNTRKDESGNVQKLNTFYQAVTEGENAGYVYAEASEGWVFAGWSDGAVNPYRLDTQVNRNKKVVAIFEPVSAPEIPNVGDYINFGGSGENDPDSNYIPPMGGGNGSGSNTHNQTVDNGQNDYGESYNQDKQDGLDKVSGNNNISDGDKGGVGDYFDSIAK